MQLSLADYMRLLRVLLVAGIGTILASLLVAEESAQIFVYLPWDSLQHSRVKVSLDETSVAEIRPGRFFMINAVPGPHVLTAGKGIPMVVEARPGGKCFVRVARQIQFGPSGKTDFPALEELSPEQARPEILNLVYVNPKKILSPAVNKEDPFLHQRPKLKTRGSGQ